MRWASTTCPSSCAMTVAKLASSGSTSMSPRLSTMVWPSVNDSSVVVIKTRQCTSGSMSRLLVTSRLFTTVSKIFVHLALRRHQADALQTVRDVLLGLAVPRALRLHRRQIVCRFCIVLHRRFDQDLA